ncbi:gag-pol polyprotein [Tanacetum coccineum]
MKAILTKNKCLTAIGERSAEVTDDTKWDKMDGNAIANLHLVLADGVLSSIEEKKMTEHINNLNTLFPQLTSLSCIIEPQERAKILLQSLPDSYDQVIINLTSNVLSDYLVFDDVAAAILEEENRRNNREDMQTSSRQVEALVVTRGRSMEPGSSKSHNHGKSKTRKKKNFKCFKCDMPGHFKKDCQGLNTSYPHGNVASTSEDGNALCCKAAVANESKKRFVDIWLCNDHELKIIGIGSIMVKMHDGTVHTIRDVRHVKGLKKNLLSLGQLDDLGCKILVERKLLPGLTKVSLPLCEHCVISKQHRLKFKTSNSRSVSYLELVHFDVWQELVQSLGGAKYFVSFIDDYSRRCWVYSIKKKSNVFEVFKVYKARVKLDSGKKIKCLKTDNGSEYTGDEFILFAGKKESKGSSQQHTLINKMEWQSG